MPWNIAPEFWKLYDQPAAERPLYPFNAEPIEEFVKSTKARQTFRSSVPNSSYRSFTLITCPSI